MTAATKCEMPQGLHCNFTSTVAGAPLSLLRWRCAQFGGELLAVCCSCCPGGDQCASVCKPQRCQDDPLYAQHKSFLLCHLEKSFLP